MEYGLAVLEGADITKDILQNIQGQGDMLPHPAGVVGIRPNGDDPATKLLKTAKMGHRGHKLAYSFKAAGVDLHADVLASKLLHNGIGHIPIFFKRHPLAAGIA